MFSIPDLHVLDVAVTRGNKYKLKKIRCKTSTREHSFHQRIVNTWNNLPDYVVDARSLNSFKNRLDKFWSSQELIYNYKAPLILGSSHSSKFLCKPDVTIEDTEPAVTKD